MDIIGYRKYKWHHGYDTFTFRAHYHYNDYTYIYLPSEKAMIFNKYAFPGYFLINRKNKVAVRKE